MSLRAALFAGLGTKLFRAELRADRPGRLCGLPEALAFLDGLGITVDFYLPEGSDVETNTLVLSVTGTAAGIAAVEEGLTGCLAKPSGIATAAAAASALAAPRSTIVCGSYKKVDARLKAVYRRAVELGGARSRMLEGRPFVYLDKTHIRLLGSVQAAAAAARAAAGPEPALVIQIHRVTGSLEAEVEAALAVGAHVLMVDTGCEADLIRCRGLLDADGRRSGDEPLVAFAGDIKMEAIPRCRDLGADIICLGKAIIDAPMLDFHLDVLDAGAGG
ncbi:MAG: quinolinate phosphoribosyl transferase [Bacillota bacterium]|nr:quinolinate phosphoribosyl transferase [Bacillota bacterium]